MPAARRLLRRRDRDDRAVLDTGRSPSTCATPGSPIPARARHPWESETVPDDTRRRGLQLREGDALRRPRRAARARSRTSCSRGDPLIRSLLAGPGAGTWLRQFTRLHRPVATLQAMRETVGELRAHLDEPTYVRRPSRSPTATASARSTPPAEASATGSGSGTARSRTTRSSRRRPGTAPRVTTRAGAGTGRRASSGWRSRISTTQSSCSTSCARTTPASSARCTSPAPGARHGRSRFA